MFGSYLIILELKEDRSIDVGSLGKLFFKKGFYVYVGSATGIISVERRVARHKRLAQQKSGNIHWHIDYLLTDEKTEFLDCITSDKDECDLSQKIEKIADDFITGFGRSDCTSGCASHLYFFEQEPYNKIWQFLNKK